MRFDASKRSPRACGGPFVEAPPHVAPAEGQPHLAFVRQGAVARVPVHLQHALMPARWASAAGLCDRARRCRPRGWIGPVLRSIVAGVSPELTGLGVPGTYKISARLHV